MTVSKLIERLATDAEKANGWDLADYLIREQQKINAYNFKIARHNANLDAEDEEIIAAERESIMVEAYA